MHDLDQAFPLVHVLFPIDLHPDVNLERTGIEIDYNNSSQCRVQFYIFVSDSIIHMYIDMYLQASVHACSCIWLLNWTNPITQLEVDQSTC